MNYSRNIKISVVMATYNPKEKNIISAINSILTQTYNNIELIIVDDGSSFDVKEMLKEQFVNDNRIFYYRVKSNQGLAYALNYGINKSTGQYIARMDDDDIAEKERFGKQIELLNSDTKMGVCFTDGIRINDKDEKIGKIKFQGSSKNIINRLLIRGNCFIHSSAMIKKEALDKLGVYNEKILYAQDYELWIRLAENYTIGIVKDYLIRWRDVGGKKKIEKEALQTGYCYYARYYYLLRHRNSIKAKIIFLLGDIYSIFQVYFRKLTQFR